MTVTTGVLNRYYVDGALYDEGRHDRLKLPRSFVVHVASVLRDRLSSYRTRDLCHVSERAILHRLNLFDDGSPASHPKPLPGRRWLQTLQVADVRARAVKSLDLKSQIIERQHGDDTDTSDTSPAFLLRTAMTREQRHEKVGIGADDLAVSAAQDRLCTSSQGCHRREVLATDVDRFAPAHGHGTSRAFSTFAVATTWICTLDRTHAWHMIDSIFVPVRYFAVQYGRDEMPASRSSISS